MKGGCAGCTLHTLRKTQSSQLVLLGESLRELSCLGAVYPSRLPASSAFRSIEQFHEPAPYSRSCGYSLERNHQNEAFRIFQFVLCSLFGRIFRSRRARPWPGGA